MMKYYCRLPTSKNERISSQWNRRTSRGIGCRAAGCGGMEEEGKERKAKAS